MVLGGFGGDGRLSAVRAAARLAGVPLLVVPDGPSYSRLRWQSDVKALLRRTGCHAAHAAIFVTAAQLEREAQLRNDIISIMTTGTIQDLFALTEQHLINEVQRRSYLQAHNKAMFFGSGHPQAT